MSETLRICINGLERAVEIIRRDNSQVRFRLHDREYTVEFTNPAVVSSSPLRAAQGFNGKVPTTPAPPVVVGSNGAIAIIAPISGIIVEVPVKVRQNVIVGEVLVRLEAMKMQNGIFATCVGTVSTVHVQVGDEVRDGQVLIEISPS